MPRGNHSGATAVIFVASLSYDSSLIHNGNSKEARLHEVLQNPSQACLVSYLRAYHAMPLAKQTCMTGQAGPPEIVGYRAWRPHELKSTRLRSGLIGDANPKSSGRFWTFILTLRQTYHAIR